MQAVHVERALVSPGALPVHFRQNVGSAADGAVVDFDALAETHTSVLGTVDDQDVLRAATGAEFSRLTVFRVF